MIRGREKSKDRKIQEIQIQKRESRKGKDGTFGRKGGEIGVRWKGA